MDQVRIIEVKQSVFADNDRRAAQLRRELKERGVFLLNLMSSPGAGKTTTLRRTVELLKDELSIGVMEADIDSDVDARAMAAAGVKAIQLHTGGMCHLDADMTRQGLDQLLAEGGVFHRPRVELRRTHQIAHVFQNGQLHAALRQQRVWTPKKKR